VPESWGWRVGKGSVDVLLAGSWCDGAVAMLAV
jgi:hypothetical protein